MEGFENDYQDDWCKGGERMEVKGWVGEAIEFNLGQLECVVLIRDPSKAIQ